MGVAFDRILDGFSGPFEIGPGRPQAPGRGFRCQGGAAGYLLDHRVNDTFVAINRLLKAGDEVFWLKDGFEADGQNISGRHDLGARRSRRRERARRRRRRSWA